MPSLASHIAVLEAISRNLLLGLIDVERALKQKAKALDKIVKDRADAFE